MNTPAFMLLATTLSYIHIKAIILTENNKAVIVCGDKLQILEKEQQDQ
jgi:hypothetical protein